MDGRPCLLAIGMNGDGELRSRNTTVVAVEPLDLPLSRTMQFRDSNLESVELLNPPNEFDGVLVDKDLVRRIQPMGAAARYEDRVGDNHHHLICRGCDTMFDIDCAVGSAPCLTADDDHGFEIDEAEVVYWGLCPSCR